MLSVSLQLLEPAQLLDLQTAVFLPPAIVGLFTDPQFTQDFCDRLSLGDAYLGLTEMTEDLFCRVTLSGHKAPFLSHTLTPGMATIQGGRAIPSIYFVSGIFKTAKLCILTADAKRATDCDVWNNLAG